LHGVEVFDQVLVHLNGLDVHVGLLKWELLDSEGFLVSALLWIASAWAAFSHIFAPFLVFAPFSGGSTEVLLTPAWSLLQALIIILNLSGSGSSLSSHNWLLFTDPLGFALYITVVSFTSPVKDFITFTF
jgi:hypothetical protein